MLRRMTQDSQGVIKERLITAAREGDVEIILGVLEEVHSDHHDDPSLQGAVDQLLSIRDSDDILQSLYPFSHLNHPYPSSCSSSSFYVCILPLFQLFSNIPFSFILSF